MQKLQRKTVTIQTNGQTCRLEHKNDPHGIWVSSEDASELEHKSYHQSQIITEQTANIGKLHAELNAAVDKIAGAYALLEAAHPIVAKSDQALRGQINYVLYKRPQGWQDNAEPIIHSSLGEKLGEPFMLPVDKSYIKDVTTNKVATLAAEVEKWKEEYRVTENARGDFESGLARCAQELKASDNVNTQLRAHLKAADDENAYLKQTCARLRESIEQKEKQITSLLNEVTQADIKSGELLRKQEITFKVECLEAEGKSTCLTPSELDAYKPAIAIKDLYARLVKSEANKDFRLVSLEKYNELEGKFAQATLLIHRIASGESYYPALEQDIYRFLKIEARKTDVSAPNMAMRLLNEVAMGRSSWSYESFNAWFSKVDALLKNQTIVTEELLRGELETAKLMNQCAWPILIELKNWAEQRNALSERTGGQPVRTPLFQKLHDFFVKFPNNPAKS